MFKLKWSDAELREHFRNRLSYHQGQIDLNKKNLKFAKDEWQEAYKVWMHKTVTGTNDYNYYPTNRSSFYQEQLLYHEKRVEMLRKYVAHLPNVDAHYLEIKDLHELELE